ncbi:hypothetical protein Rt10032_c02g0857 [Rhodotorula toruloides]|uniref:Uncharacterized protein n=1 Tax=Rhodotorula toruloides TaxID=5286 RepID=A0A511K929_RHOTO|nr:hypothetical protein Rt10032_c02g0857 [Rhodotorula toruloides]
MWNHRGDHDNRHAAFVQLTSRKKGHLHWSMFDDYDIILAGYLDDGEFAGLPAAKQQRTVKLLLRSTRDKAACARFIFRNCVLERADGRSVHVQEVNEQKQEERVWKTLMENNGSLLLFWTMMVYHGINQQEFEECQTRPEQPSLKGEGKRSRAPPPPDEKPDINPKRGRVGAE